jgi:hypothetical protein
MTPTAEIEMHSKVVPWLMKKVEMFIKQDLNTAQNSHEVIE